MAVGPVDALVRDDGEVRAAVGGRECAALAQEGASDLDRVARGLQSLDTCVRGDDTRDLGADRLGRLAAEDRRPLRTHAPCDVAEDAPFTARLSDAWTGDLGTEGDPALRRRRRPAALLLIARRRR